MKKISIILWTITIIFTVVTAIFQRRTGPTKPVTGSIEIENSVIKYKLLRSATIGKNAEISIDVDNNDIHGYVRYKRFRSFDNWTEEKLIPRNGSLIVSLPELPPAGKIMYQIVLQRNDKNYSLTQEPVIMRYKGNVPALYLIPHILFMFIAMLYSNRAALEVFFNKRNLFKLSFITLLSLVVGGLVFGPIVQKFAFGDYWTGFPFGHDLTDNKTAFAVFFWGIATYKSFRNTPKARWWVFLAAIILLATYMIPHSLLGSELDFTAEVTNM